MTAVLKRTCLIWETIGNHLRSIKLSLGNKLSVVLLKGFLSEKANEMSQQFTRRFGQDESLLFNRKPVPPKSKVQFNTSTYEILFREKLQAHL